MEWSPKAVRIRSLSKEEATHGMTFVEEHSPRYVTWIMQKKSEFHWDLGAQSFMPYTSNLWPLKGVQFFPKKSSGHCGLVTKVPSRVIHIFLRDLPNIHFTHTSNCNRGRERDFWKQSERVLAIKSTLTVSIRVGIKIEGCWLFIFWRIRQIFQAPWTTQRPPWDEKSVGQWKMGKTKTRSK